MELKTNGLPFGVAIETPLLEDVALRPNRRKDGGVDVSLLGETLLEPERIPTVDEGLVNPDKLLLDGSWVDALLPEGAEFDSFALPSGDSACF